MRLQTITFVYPELEVYEVFTNTGTLKDYVQDMVEFYELGGRTFDWKNSKAFDDDGQEIGRVSMNGRVWDKDENEFFLGDGS